MSKSRLFGIIYYLLNNKKSTTATGLAKVFEVSTRTIYRDIDTLSTMGIPIYTEAGRNGGIHLLSNFTLNKVLLSKEEQNSLLLALKVLKQINPKINSQSFLKLQSLFKNSFDDWLEVDFSNWHQTNNNAQTFTLLKSAILNQRQIKFNYIKANGRLEKRRCDPFKLIFKAQAWYLQGFCLTRNEFRTFKINRMSSIKILKQTFSSKSVPKIPKINLQEQTIHLRLLFSERICCRVYDEFNHHDIHSRDDGTVVVDTDLPNEGWLIRYLLSFGKYIKILSPKSIKSKMKQELNEIYRNI